MKGVIVCGNFLHREKTLNCLLMIGNLYDTIMEATNAKFWLYSSVQQ